MKEKIFGIVSAVLGAVESGAATLKRRVVDEDCFGGACSDIGECASRICGDMASACKSVANRFVGK